MLREILEHENGWFRRGLAGLCVLLCDFLSIPPYKYYQHLLSLTCWGLVPSLQGEFLISNYCLEKLVLFAAVAGTTVLKP